MVIIHILIDEIGKFSMHNQNVFFFIFFFTTEYYDVVEDSLASYSEDCVNAVQKSIEQVEILLRHMIGQESLNVKFK